MINIRFQMCMLILLAPGLAKTQSVFVQDTTAQLTQTITMKDFRYRAASENDRSLFAPARKKPGLALLSSALLPGSGQAINSKWGRAGAYLLAEAVTLTIHVMSLQEARKQQRQYEQFADQNWSVVTYAGWLVNYYEQNNISSSHIDDLQSQIAGHEPAYNPDIDWKVVDIELLRNVERNTPFIYPDQRGNNFSHVMPDYGSQQYYELISKYYQFGPGWMDFGKNKNGEPLDNRYKLNWNGTDMPVNFFRGAALAETFNDNYRLAGNMVSLLILNHIVSAFDAFLTVKIKNNRLNAEANVLKREMFSLTYRF